VLAGNSIKTKHRLSLLHLQYNRAVIFRYSPAVDYSKIITIETGKRIGKP
jgi:hypothetical protein